MNFAEELVYWYLRLNGFFPITNFVLHHDAEHQTSDADIIAVRFPYVSEAIGEQPHDWDRRFADDWEIRLETETVGLVVEVKSGRWAARDLAERAWRVEAGLKRMGMLPAGEVLDGALAALEANAVARVGGYTFAKLLVGDGGTRQQFPWVRLTLGEADEFVVDRMRRYHDRKHGDRLFFTGELIQYLAWKSAPPAE